MKESKENRRNETTKSNILVNKKKPHFIFFLQCGCWKQWETLSYEPHKNSLGYPDKKPHKIMWKKYKENGKIMQSAVNLPEMVVIFLLTHL